MSVHSIHAAELPAQRRSDAFTDRRPGPLDPQRALRDAGQGSETDAAFGRWLDARMADRCLPGGADERVASAARSLLHHGAQPIDDLARRHDMSRRQLERDFRRCLGVSPAACARAVRFQRAVDAVSRGVPLAHVAADFGYADQAHMTRTFRDLAGLTPRQVRERAIGRAMPTRSPDLTIPFGR